MKLTLKNVRLAFPHIFAPKIQTDEKTGKVSKTYKAAYPIEPGSKNHTIIKEAMQTAAKEKWKDKAPAIFKKLKEDRKVCFEERAPSNDEGEVYGGFEDMFVLNSSRNASRRPPTVVDRDRTPLTEEDGKPYGGCYVNAIIDIWAYEGPYGKRVSCELLGVQFVKDGEAFGGGAAASADDFDELEDIDGDEEDEFA